MAPEVKGMKKVTIWLKEGQLEWLQKVHTATGVPMAESVRRAIDRYHEEGGPYFMAKKSAHEMKKVRQFMPKKSVGK